MGAAEWSGQLFKYRRQKAVNTARKLVKQKGALATLIGRFALIIHPAIPPAIGFLGIKLRTFILFDALAVSLWVLLYMGLGHMASGIWIKQTFEIVEVGGLVIVILAILLFIHRIHSNIHHH